MIRKILLLSLFFFNNLIGQTIPDSLKVYYDTCHSNDSKYTFWLKYTRMYAIQKDEDHSIWFANQMIEDFKNESDNKWYAKAMVEKGIDYIISGNSEKAIKSFKESIQKMDPVSNMVQIGYANRNIASAMWNIGITDSALVYFYESLFWLEQTTDSLFLGLTYLEMGKLQYNLHSPDNAWNYAIKATKCFESLADTNNLSSCYNLMGLILLNRKLKDFDFADSLIDKAILFSEATGNQQGIIVQKINKGIILGERGKFKEAISKYQEIEKVIRQFVNSSQVGLFYANYAYAHLKDGQFEKAIILCDSSLKYSYETNNLVMREHAYEYRWKALWAMKKYEEALTNADSFVSLQSKNLTSDFETMLNGRELELELKVEQAKSKLILEQANRRAQYNLWLSIALGIGFILLLGLVIALRRIQRNNNKISSQKEQIEEQKERLQKLNLSKDRLFSIIGHDLRGPLGNIRQLLEIIPMEEPNLSVNSRKYLELSNQGLTEAQTLLENLMIWAKHQDKHIEVALAQTDLTFVIQRATHLNAPLLHSKKMKLVTNIEENLTAKIDADLVYTVLRNLLSNSIKYSPEGSKVIVDAWRDTIGLHVTVKDFGPGIPKDLLENLFSEDTDHFKGKSNSGLGLRLCKQLAELHGGKFYLHSDENGTIAEIILLD